ncbi:MAG: HAD hydrolase family protein [Galactobacillus timonensis]|jgi:Cof subfamily protein (haloacid dehalogenase superfamily)|uniref:HAD family hydrolase n=1 Tax=Galactobacillus timonensis TaxID=2041840 RepID=UPI0024096163|nr:HAD hydrolase family protein [Galactobacillus timonensis]MDD5851532.1 HAD hydrolase family protein [Galactobacillus timonensis]MDD6370338.1 HAD hydrolase family protein [Galactobacillus timonensis]MDD6600411.1 HAD hydrolase family protein [Galactobacillus timonensis]MDD6680361.1 HAD hydrolase family protein [Galactobacillus timonensis]
MNKQGKIGLIAVDLDNTTLVPGKDSYSPRLVKDIQLCSQNGVHFMLNTGRHYTMIPPKVFAALPNGLIGTINGACLVDHEGHVLRKHPMSKEDMDALVHWCDIYDVGLGFKFEDAVAAYVNYEKFRDGYSHGDPFVADSILDCTATRDHHCSVGLPLGTFIICDDATEAKLKPLLPQFTFAWSAWNGFDVFLNNVTKALTVQDALEYYGLGWENVLSFGDAENDTAFLVAAGYGYAMANAVPEVKAAARYMCESCEDDGVAKTIERLVLGGEINDGHK